MKVWLVTINGKPEKSVYKALKTVCEDYKISHNKAKRGQRLFYPIELIECELIGFEKRGYSIYEQKTNGKREQFNY